MAPFTVKFYKNNREDKVINIDIINSDITNIKCHILVNSCQNNLGSGSGVHGAIRSAAGQPYIDECNRLMCNRGYKVLNATEYVITDAGNMKNVGKIFNIRAPINNTDDDSEQEPALKIAYNNIFDYVIDNNQYTDKVIAMTTLGTGIFNISIGISTLVLMQSLKHKLKKMLDSSVRRIIIVSNDQTQIDAIIDMVKQFVKIWNKRSQFENYTFEIIV
jgi:O-acetyl-ADP-ribose deacetylase (regulator of RNase III)